jgi:methionyl-tRNA synthetase
MESFDFRRAAEAILELATAANGYLNERAPWSLMKREENRAAVGADLYAVLETNRWVAVLLTPLLPDLAERMLAQLGLAPIQSGVPQPGDRQTASLAPEPLWSASLSWGLLTCGAALPEPVPVMQRLELATPL